MARKIHFKTLHHSEKNRKPSEALPNKDFEIYHSPYGCGHTYTLEVSLQGPIQEDSGMILNLRELDLLLKEVVSPFQDHHLNSKELGLEVKVKTTEGLALSLRSKILEKLKTSNSKKIQLVKIRLYESENYWIDLVEDRS
ncbi:MAG: 6-carboxytetrahydropterin synthase [Bdellovibrionales bacterium]|nr:6-carboxytetrahydropterin synthase [Bdellovibrionales bacterium]